LRRVILPQAVDGVFGLTRRRGERFRKEEDFRAQRRRGAERRREEKKEKGWLAVRPFNDVGFVRRDLERKAAAPQ